MKQRIVMIKMNSHEAKLNFSQLLTQIANGKEIIITRSGKDFAKITPLNIMSKQRKPGQDSELDVEEAWIADDFNTPLPADLQQYFQ
jgi:antitoxin (DNA-binding transcriptional repressor) of toxin-antitoxin stability system